MDGLGVRTITFPPKLISAAMRHAACSARASNGGACGAGGLEEVLHFLERRRLYIRQQTIQDVRCGLCPGSLHSSICCTQPGALRVKCRATTDTNNSAVYWAHRGAGPQRRAVLPRVQRVLAPQHVPSGPPPLYLPPTSLAACRQESAADGLQRSAAQEAARVDLDAVLEGRQKQQLRDLSPRERPKTQKRDSRDETPPR